MNWKKRLMAVFCAAVMLFTLSAPPAQASGDIIFIALNEWMPPKLSSATMPISYYNTFYVPYVIFDMNYTGVDLGIRVAATGNTVTLYTKRRKLTYDLDAGTCTDKDGNNYKRAAVIGGITYLPISAVRDYFSEEGLLFSQIATDYGPLLRLTTPSVYLSDTMFADAATSSIADAVKKYNASLNPSPSPSPAITPSPSPSPSPSTTPGPGEEPNKSGVSVYLSFRCSGGTQTTALLNTLEREGLSGLFFFAPEELAANETLIRRMIGSGHAIGLTIPGGPAEDAKALLAEGNRLLSMIAHTNTRTVAIENADSATTIALEAAGWGVYTSNVPVSPKNTASAYSRSLMNIVNAKNAVARLLLDDASLTINTLPLLIDALREDKYSIRLAVGGVLG